MVKRTYEAPKMKDTTFCKPCFEQNQETEAAFHFVWAWGEEGDCCAHHRTELQQLATERLNRTIEFTPLSPAPPPDLSGELAFAKSKLLEMESIIHEQAETIRRHQETISTLNAELGKAGKNLSET